jgi:hypothetical protein
MREPRKAGGIYYTGYWGYYYQVVSIELDEWGYLKNITVRTPASDSSALRTWSHSTAWEPKRDRIIAQPHEIKALKEFVASL